MTDNIFTCCICGQMFCGYGNNPYGAVYKNDKGEIIEPEFKEDDRCCDECDQLYVIPGRIYRWQKAKEKGAK